MSKDSYIPPKATPRRPPVEDVNNTDLMLGSVLLGIVVAVVVLIVVWAVTR
jgi:hypothetical protein